jgi:uncharacterized protein (TIGR00299 family) protein
MGTHIHLDLVGGLSGDMFIGAMLDIFPERASDLQDVIVAAGFPNLVALDCKAHDDGTLTGTKFDVSAVEKEHHHHRHYSEIKDVLTNSSLDKATCEAALSMFREIAEVEAAIHGKSVEAVAFHEVGAWDSIADVVLAAFLITQADATWSISTIPIGSGFVETAHGRLPVPAPATARLLEGFEVTDDGIAGERVTPTGAAILKFLAPARSIPDGHVLSKSGYGFGTKQFPGISNTVRACVYTTAASSADNVWTEDRIARLSFELDDQTPESIAHAVLSLRENPAVIDVSQQVFFGKKNRQGFSISVLVNQEAVDEVTRQCFELTTTLGVRRELIDRAILNRQEIIVYVNERAYRVKVANRPGGYTAKIEMDDLLAADLTLTEQQQVRQQAESLAVRQVEEQQ